MSQKPRSTKAYPPEFRAKAVKLITELGYTIDQVAEKLGCSKESVRRWKEAARPKLDPETALRIELGEDENKRLRDENARLKIEVEILKKPRRTSRKRCKSEVRLDRRTSNSLARLANERRARRFHERLLRLEETQGRSADAERASP